MQPRTSLTSHDVLLHTPRRAQRSGMDLERLGRFDDKGDIVWRWSCVLCLMRRLLVGEGVREQGWVKLRSGVEWTRIAHIETRS